MGAASSALGAGLTPHRSLSQPPRIGHHPALASPVTWDLCILDPMPLPTASSGLSQNPASAGTRAEQASLGPSRLASVPHCSPESGTLHLTGGGENPRGLLVRASGDRIEAWGLPASLNHSSPLETLGVPAALGQVLQARPQDEVSGPWSGGPGRVAGWGHYESRVCQGPLGPA